MFQRISGGTSSRRRKSRQGSGAGIAALVVAALAFGAFGGWWAASRIVGDRTPPHREAVARPQPPAPPPVAVAPKPVEEPPVSAPVEAQPPAAAEPQVAALPPPAVTPGAPAWRRNALPFTPVAGRPMIAIVIDDMGVDARRSAQVIAMNVPLTTSFLSYAHNLRQQATEARAHGHELLLHMPMEPLGEGYDPGPDVLLTSMSADVVEARLTQSLASFNGYVGINNHMGSKFTSSEASMHPVMRVLHKDGLLFLDSLTSAKSVGAKIAQAEGVPNLTRQVFIDDNPSPAMIREQLLRVEEHARKTGSAIAIGHPRDTTIEALRAWLPTLPDKGFQLVPLTALAKAKYGKE